MTCTETSLRPKSLLITGCNGTFAPVVCKRASTLGFAVRAWDRQQVSADDASASLQWLQKVQPDAIAHLAMGSEAWAALLAGYARQAAIPFLFTSTAMVFHHEPDGPHRVGDIRSAKDDYGQYKIRCEDAILAVNPQAMVARIGWQIDPGAAGNNMLMALDGWQSREGCVAASSVWIPACSFMEDTATALLDFIRKPEAGIHHLDSNAKEGYPFDAIVRALKAQFQRNQWQVRVHQDYRHDQRLIAPHTRMPDLSCRLPALR